MSARFPASLLVPLALAALLPSCAGPTLALPGQGKLDRMREETNDDDSRKGKVGTGRKPKRRRGGGHHHDDDDEWVDEVDVTLAFYSANALAYSLALPFMLPVAVLGDDYLEEGRFLKHPYEDNRPGYMVIGDEDGREWAVHIETENGFDFDDDIYRAGIRGRVDTTTRFGLTASYTYLREDLGANGQDDTNLGEVTAFYRFAQNELAQFRAGIGYRFMSDDRNYKGGVNLLYGFDFFPVRPLSLSGSVELGGLGSATVVHSRIKAGVDLHELEIYLGYDHLRVGSVRIHGPLVGLRLFF